MTQFDRLLRILGISTATITRGTGLSYSAVDNLRTGEHDPHVSTLELVSEHLNDMPVELIEHLVGRQGTHRGKPALGKGRSASTPRTWGSLCHACNTQRSCAGECLCH